jgi:hypothetical protein
VPGKAPKPHLAIYLNGAFGSFLILAARSGSLKEEGRKSPSVHSSV